MTPGAPAAGSGTAFQRLRKQLALVDLVFEVADARLPRSSRHPCAGELFGARPRLIVLAKQDLSSAEHLAPWIASLNRLPGCLCVAVSLKREGRQRVLLSRALELAGGRRARLATRGVRPRALRAMVVGLPNVAKSSLINWLVGRHKAAVGDRPGITRGEQWVRVHPDLELLDTPGVLPPYTFDSATREKLSLCNILDEGHWDPESLASAGLAMVSSLNSQALELYGESFADQPTLENLARARSCLGAGGVPDTRRAAYLFLGDFRAGRLGRYVMDSLQVSDERK